MTRLEYATRLLTTLIAADPDCEAVVRTLRSMGRGDLKIVTCLRQRMEELDVDPSIPENLDQSNTAGAGTD